MKYKMLCFLVFTLIASTLSFCACAEGPYYYADTETNTYHVKWDCPEIQAINQPNLIEFAYDQLSELPFETIQRCENCFSLVSMDRIPAGTRSFHYLSPYNTGDEKCNVQAGAYQEGRDLASGIYTASSCMECQQELVLKDRDGNTLHSFHVQNNTTITFYLGRDMTLLIPDGCTVQKLVYTPLFQNTKEKTGIQHSRYITMLEIPGRLYTIGSLPGKVGYCIISNIRSEVGAESDCIFRIEDGNTVQVDLRDQYDVFVEFIDCIVWPSEDGIG